MFSGDRQKLCTLTMNSSTGTFSVEKESKQRHAMEHAFIDVFQTRNKAVFHKAVKSVNNGLDALTEKKNAA